MVNDEPSPSSATDPTAPRRSPGWGGAWLRALLGIGRITPARREKVLAEIGAGSQPSSTYYVLLGISELLAGFALMVDSDALLIGANVVAPLMTPIFGTSLGLMRGDLLLLRKALLAEFGGAAIGVGLCWLQGLLPLMDQPTPALLSQTQPTLIDLIIAALAGFAGVLATMDEHVSPALPGIAIATALNPPIAAIGLCLATGAYDGAWGAFLLFIANVLAILAVGAGLFLAAGFVSRREIGSLGSLARRFAPAVMGLALVAVLLTKHLLVLIDKERTDNTIRATLESALAEEPNASLGNLAFSRGNDGIEILATVTALHPVAPAFVKRVQDTLNTKLGAPVHLFIRCTSTNDVAATGSTSLRSTLGLDGRVIEAPQAPTMRLWQESEQVVRELVASHPELVLKNVELVQFPTGPVLIITVDSPRAPDPALVASFETALQQRVADPNLRVLVRRDASTDITAKGRILLGGAHFGEISDEEGARRHTVEATVRDRIETLPSMFAIAVDAVPQDTGWQVRAEIVGTRVVTPAEIRAIETETTRALGVPVNITAWTRTELQVTRDGAAPVGN